MKAGQKIKDEQIPQVLARYRSGEALRFIARDYRVTTQCISVIARKSGCKMRVSDRTRSLQSVVQTRSQRWWREREVIVANAKLTHWQRQALAERYEEGTYTKVIGYEFGVHPATVCKVVASLGRPLRKPNRKSRLQHHSQRLIQEACLENQATA